MNPGKGIAALLSLGAMLALSACNTSDDLAGHLEDAESTRGTALLSLNITDAAADNAEHVYVLFTGVTLKHEDLPPQAFEFDAPRRIDLLALQGDAFDRLFADETVVAGRYEWATLQVTALRGEMDSTLVIDGKRHSLFVPGGAETGLKLNGFDVPVNQAAAFTIDFDLRRSVLNPPGLGDYILKPTLRLVDNSTAGHISGSVNLADFKCTEKNNAVYVYSGRDAALNDLDSQGEAGANPLTTASVQWHEESGTYQFSAGFLSAGDYTVALTCGADLDDPEAEDTLLFQASQTLSVTAGEHTRVEFAATDAKQTAAE